MSSSIQGYTIVLKQQLQNVDEKPCILWIAIAGDVEQFRILSHSYQDIFLVCFSTVIPESLENVSERWIPKIKIRCKGLSAPTIILVGTQTDLWQDKATIDKLADKDQAPISFEVRSKVPKQLNAAKYFECSAMTMEGMRTVLIGQFLKE